MHNSCAKGWACDELVIALEGNPSLYSYLGEILLA